MEEIQLYCTTDVEGNILSSTYGRNIEAPDEYDVFLLVDDATIEAISTRPHKIIMEQGEYRIVEETTE